MDPKMHGKALNADAITEILLRLPAKSVCRFRCVSKLWLSLLSDPPFLRAHAAAAAPAETSGLYVYDQYLRKGEYCPLNGGGGGCPDPTLSFLDHGGIPPEPVDSCNGLLLFRPPQKLEWEPYVLSVCNPTTKEHEAIPLPPDIRPEIIRPFLRLAFDPRRSPNYRILIAARAGGIEGRPIYKYSSETRLWKLFEVRSKICHQSVYWNGFIVFVWSVVINTPMLSALDVEGEQIHAMSLPPPINMERFLHLAASGDRLHYIKGENYIRFDILEMSSVSSGWHVLHRVDLDSIRRPCDQSLPFISFILGFIGGDEDQLLLQIRSSQMQDIMVSCHLQQKIFTTFPQVQPGLCRNTIFPLAHSLFPIGTPSTSV